MIQFLGRGERNNIWIIILFEINHFSKIWILFWCGGSKSRRKKKKKKVQGHWYISMQSEFKFIHSNSDSGLTRILSISYSVQQKWASISDQIKYFTKHKDSLNWFLCLFNNKYTKINRGDYVRGEGENIKYISIYI